MERTWKEINETIVSENDLMSLTKSHNVSVYRRENFKNYESITYRCSQYRTFTKCQYQLKAKIYHDGTYQIFYSQHHEHELLEDTRLPTDIRSNIRDLAMKGLTINQIQKMMEYEKKNIRSSITFIDDLKAWCSSRASYPHPDKIHQPFVPFFEVTNIDNIFVCITTRQLLSTSTDETTETFVTFLKGIQVWAATANHQPYTKNVIMADGAPGLTAAV
ncbi:unnamed protein product [Rotaria sp. Silwood1]|nr:unnamed protein product [Rotaria sp. Silwood1]CAF1576740.1 unnamed protein product [Rotaria sp. Silwood1]